MTASLDPMVETPTAVSCGWAWKRSATMLTQRRSISAVAGYSSLSIMFLSNASTMSSSACGSIQVVTNVARFSRELPSSSSSSWIRRSAESGKVLSSGIRFLGTGSSRQPAAVRDGHQRLLGAGVVADLVHGGALRRCGQVESSGLGRRPAHPFRRSRSRGVRGVRPGPGVRDGPG